MKTLLERAKEIAHRAHAGQFDKAGRPYIEHVQRVAAAVSDDIEAEIVAWLHDVGEDHPEYYEEIGKCLPASLYIAVRHLDRNLNGTDYYERIKKNPIARRVKLADIADNMNECRLAMLDKSTRERLRRKYREALEVLQY